MNVPKQSFDIDLCRKKFSGLNFTTDSSLLFFVHLLDEGNHSIQIKTLLYETSKLHVKKGIILESTQIYHFKNIIYFRSTIQLSRNYKSGPTLKNFFVNSVRVL